MASINSIITIFVVAVIGFCYCGVAVSNRVGENDFGLTQTEIEKYSIFYDPVKKERLKIFDVERVEQPVFESFAALQNLTDIKAVGFLATNCTSGIWYLQCTQPLILSDLNINTTFSAGITVDVQKVAITMMAQLNGVTVLNSTVSGSNPPGLCFPLGGISVCIVVSNLNLPGGNSINFCANGTFSVGSTVWVNLQLACPTYPLPIAIPISKIGNLTEHPEVAVDQTLQQKWLDFVKTQNELASTAEEALELVYGAYRRNASNSATTTTASPPPPTTITPTSPQPTTTSPPPTTTSPSPTTSSPSPTTTTTPSTPSPPPTTTTPPTSSPPTSTTTPPTTTTTPDIPKKVPEAVEVTDNDLTSTPFDEDVDATTTIDNLI